MSYGDPTRNVSSGIQTGGFNVPRASLNNQYRIVKAAPILGDRQLDQDPRTNTTGFALPAKPGKVVVDFQEDSVLTVIGGMKEILAGVGAVSVSNPTAGVYEHTGTFSRTAANTRYFTREYDIDGRIASVMDSRVYGVRIEAKAGGPFVDTKTKMVGRYVSHGQFIPTATSGPATYTGVVYTTGRALTDTAALTFNITCETAGTGIGDGTCTLKTKLSSEGAYTVGSARPVYNNVPFRIFSAAGVYQGMDVIFTTGGNNILANTDTWTVSSRGTVTSGTIATPTLFTWNSPECDILFDNGASFSFSPESFFFDLDLNLKKDLNVGGSNYAVKFPPNGPATLKCGWTALAEDARYLCRAWNNSVYSFRVRFQGAYIGATVYQQAVDITLPYLRAKPFTEELSTNFLIMHTLEGDGHGSTPLLDDALSLMVRNDTAVMTT